MVDIRCADHRVHDDIINLRNFAWLSDLRDARNLKVLRLPITFRVAPLTGTFGLPRLGVPTAFKAPGGESFWYPELVHFWHLTSLEEIHVDVPLEFCGELLLRLPTAANVHIYISDTVAPFWLVRQRGKRSSPPCVREIVNIVEQCKSIAVASRSPQAVDSVVSVALQGSFSCVRSGTMQEIERALRALCRRFRRLSFGDDISRNTSVDFRCEFPHMCEKCSSS